MKTIGVLGGMSAQATMDFEERVHRVSQRLIPQLANSGYPPMVVNYFREPPFLVTANGKPISPLRTNPHFVEAAHQLGPLVDFLVITANAAHRSQEEIERASGRKVLSMVDLTLQEVQRRQWRKVGVLGLGEPLVYQVPLERLGIAGETIAGELRDRLDLAIIHLMEGRVDAASRAVAREAVDSLRARNVDGVILGCTEIPLLLGEEANAPDLVNPIEYLAEAAVRAALQETEEQPSFFLS